MARRVSALLAAALVVGLAACSGGHDPDGAPSDVPSTTTTSVEFAAGDADAIEADLTSGDPARVTTALMLPESRTPTDDQARDLQDLAIRFDLENLESAAPGLGVVDVWLRPSPNVEEVRLSALLIEVDGEWRVASFTEGARPESIADIEALALESATREQPVADTVAFDQAQAVPVSDTVTCEESTPPSTVAADRWPVVLVHGWGFGSPATWGSPDDPSSSAGKLAAELGEDYQLFLFDYADASTTWASRPVIAGCLADYLAAVADASRAVGGPGTVHAIGHSMGGLAIRYAAALDRDGAPVADLIASYSSFDTPHQGSYWGGTDYATGADDLRDRLRLRVPDGDAGRCLATHLPGQPLPDGCGDLPPYLSTGTPITLVSGSIAVERDPIPFLPWDNYTYYLGGDGIVPIESQGGYPGSGEGDLETGQDLRLEQVSCVSPDYKIIWWMYLAFPQHAPLILATWLGIDSGAMDAVLAGEANPDLAAASVLPLFVAGCGHLNIIKDDQAVDLVAERIRSVPWPAGEFSPYLGTWTGPIEQGGSSYYSVELTLELVDGEIEGVVRYPELDNCSGTLDDATLVGGSLHVTEHIMIGAGTDCVETGPLVLTPNGERLQYNWGEGVATGLLTRGRYSEVTGQWPTGRNDGPPVLYAWIGANMMEFPAWVACDSNVDWCLLGGAMTHTLVAMDGLDVVGTIANSSPDPAGALASLGVPPGSVTEILGS